MNGVNQSFEGIRGRNPQVAQIAETISILSYSIFLANGPRIETNLLLFESLSVSIPVLITAECENARVIMMSRSCTRIWTG